jgi:flagellar FliL protein
MKAGTPCSVLTEQQGFRRLRIEVSPEIMSKAPNPANAEAKPKGKGRLLIIIAAAVVLLGGGAGAYFLLKPPVDDKAGAKHVVVRTPAIYIALEPPFVSNFDASAGTRFLQITVQLMTRAPEMAEFLKQHDPVIRNDLLLLFGNQQVNEVSSREGKEKLRATALEAIRKIIVAEGGRPEELEAVYFTSFVIGKRRGPSIMSIDAVQSEAGQAESPPLISTAAGTSSEVNIDVILDVPVTLSLEVGRTRLPIRSLLQLNQVQWWN